MGRLHERHLAGFRTTKNGRDGLDEFRRALYGEHYGRPIWTVEVVPAVAVT